MSFKGKKKSKIYDSREGYNLHAPAYDRKTFFLDSFERDVVMKLLGNLSGKKVLDLGCGTGRLIGHLLELGATVVACDVSEEMMKIAKRKFNRVEFFLADAEELPFENSSFDLVIASFLVVHLQNPSFAFKEVYRVLKPDGVFILTNINQRKAPKLKAGNEEIVIQSFYHRPEKIIEDLEESLFKIEKEEFVKENNVWVNQVIKARKI